MKSDWALAPGVVCHDQKLTMQFFPGTGNCFACLQVFNSTSHFRIPTLLDEATGSASAPFEKIGNLRFLMWSTGCGSSNRLEYC
jgi:hypothetical protein